MKLEKSAMEILRLLIDIYGDAIISRARVFEWHKRFLKSRIEVEDEQRKVIHVLQKVTITF